MSPETLRRLKRAALELEAACDALEDVDRYGLSPRVRARREESVAVAMREMQTAHASATREVAA
jgi:hypothetical protein